MATLTKLAEEKPRRLLMVKLVKWIHPGIYLQFILVEIHPLEKRSRCDEYAEFLRNSAVIDSVLRFVVGWKT